MSNQIHLFRKEPAEPSEQELFREYYPVLLSVMEEIHPLLERSLDQREILAMASMHLGRLIRARHRVNRREMRKNIEKYLVETFGLDTEIPGAADMKDLPPLQDEDIMESRILVVDDSAMARRQIRFFLERDKFEVYEAKSGEESLWLVTEVDPDLVLMDVSMDGMDGMEACRRIKEDAVNANVPIIFLSAKGEREEIVRGFKCGAIDYIVKPFHPAESLTRIRNHLRIRKLVLQREKHIFQLKHLNQTKDRILRVASHDIRNPVSAIVGLADFLMEESHDGFTESQKDIVHCIQDAGSSVVGLLNELLDITAMDNGTVTDKRERVNFSEMIRNLVPLYKGEAERKNISLEFSCDASDPVISADRQQVRRVADNLISNALKFTPHGGSVRAGCRRENGTFEFHVEDTGPGIPEKDVDKLFKEFGKTSNLPTGGEKSTGLGLSICQRIVEAHGGKIGFVNLRSGGARFSVRLPAG